MFRNYLKITFRNLAYQKLYTFINIFGLAMGIACCILIYLFVRNEWSYDSFHEDSANIYRIYITEDLPGRDPFSYVPTPVQLASALRTSFPEVQRTVQLDSRTDIIRVGENNYTQRYHLADPDFFKVFSFLIVSGNRNQPLQTPNSVVLTERMATKLFGDAAVFAILIACLGLFGLATLTAARRTKEVGVRKVLGATVTGIVTLLAKDFLKLVLIANFVAWPVAWLLMNNWLQDFAYRIEIGWWIFVTAGGMALLIALLTVGVQTVKAARANPVESLRYE